MLSATNIMNVIFNNIANININSRKTCIINMINININNTEGHVMCLYVRLIMLHGDGLMLTCWWVRVGWTIAGGHLTLSKPDIFYRSIELI